MIPHGDDVLSFLAHVDAPDSAWVNGVGAVEGVELAVARGSEDERVAVPGRATLVSLSGPKAGPLMVLLARADADGVKLFAGRLVKARSAGVTVSLAGPSVGDVASPEDPPRPSWVPPHVTDVEPSPRPAPAGAPGWSELAAIKPPEDDDDEADELPKYGDRVDHGVFGLCDVMVVRGDRMKIRDVHGTGRMREVHVGAFRILKPTVRDGKRVFKLGKRG